jgi:sulfate adenylyltransferase subunit 2
MSIPSNGLGHLNERRRRAVELRVSGRSLPQIRAETGLSAPTIIAAFKAFLAGGWTAVPVKARGRTFGEGRALSGTQEAEVRQAVLSAAPEAVSLDVPLWDAHAVSAFVAQKFNLTLGERTVTRYLGRWGLQFELLRDVAAQTPQGERWLHEVLKPTVQRVRSQRAQLHWCAHASVATVNGPATVLLAATPRGSLAWLPLKALTDSRSHIDFFERLLRAVPGRLTLMVHGVDLTRTSRLKQWLADQERITALDCPLAPCPRLRTQTLPARPAALSRLPQPPPHQQRNGAGTPSPGLLPTAIAAPLSIPRPTTHRDLPMKLTHLQRLEAESIHIMREVVAEAENPAMLYSIGKDSAVMLHLARKAFFPSPPPFPLLHVDTTWKFRDMYAMRERMANELGMQLLVYQNPEAKELGINPFDHGSQIHTDMWKTQGLKQALDKHGFDAAFGGARRDEEKSRAKERIFSFRSAQHRWDPKSQRPELWHQYNARKHKGESIRVFPISNWTELDIWQYIYLENVPIVPLYFSKERPVVERDGALIMVDDERMPLQPNEVPVMRKVRFRTLGCYPLTGAIESEADTLPAIIQEMLLTRTSERQGRMIDHDTSASMEKKKQEGYF